MRISEQVWTLRDIELRRRYVHNKYSPQRLGGCSSGNIKNILVIQAASRSGSSFLYRLLSAQPGVISLNGEDIVFQKLAGIGPVNSVNDSDFLPPDFNPGEAALKSIADNILLDAGSVASGAGATPPAHYAADCVQRFLLQWPGTPADPDELYNCAVKAVEAESAKAGPFNSRLAWASFLALLNARGIAANPWYYDLQPELIRELLPGHKPPSGPPALGGLEEPPFVIAEPRVLPGAAGADNVTLLLKSSSNCYRAGLIQKLFPSARLKSVRLSRNPMAAINGLMDGWLSNGFFSRDLGNVTPLEIKGYTVAQQPWTQNWWKFDLPPGWAQYRNKNLAEVCAFQWSSANRRILEDSAAGLLGETIQVRYEDLLQEASLRRQLERITAFAGLPLASTVSQLTAAPVMTVTPPRPYKWLARKDTLLPLCRAPELIDIAQRLQYKLHNPEELP